MLLEKYKSRITLTGILLLNLQSRFLETPTRRKKTT